MFTPTVKYVPEWFPGAGFKTFARVTKKDLGDSMDHPFQYVKETSQVCEPPLPRLVQVPYQNELQAESPTNSSIVGTCLEELPELAKQGVDEGVVRDVCGTIFLGEHQPYGTDGFHLTRSSCPGSVDTVSRTRRPQVIC